MAPAALVAVPAVLRSVRVDLADQAVLRVVPAVRAVLVAQVVLVVLVVHLASSRARPVSSPALLVNSQVVPVAQAVPVSPHLVK